MGFHDETGIAAAVAGKRKFLSLQALNEIIKGDKALTPATALQLERALDVPAHIWIGLESRYRLVKAKEEGKKLIQKEVSHLSNTPYEKPAELGCVERTRDDGHKVRELHRFYGVSSLITVLLISSRDLGDDYFWARLFHGIGHFLLHRRTTFICGGAADPEVEVFEKEANDFAARMVGNRGPARPGGFR